MIELVRLFAGNLQTRVRELVEKEPARIRGYGTTLAVGGALWVANALGVDLSPEMILLIGGIGAGVSYELIRAVAFSPFTVQKIANAATYQDAGTAVDIGTPPEGNVG